MNSGGK